MFKEYLYLRKKYLLFYLCVIVFFPIINFLYGQAMEPILYSCLIFSFFFFLWLLFDYLYIKGKLRNMDSILNHISCNNHTLPEAKDVVEEKYQKIINKLYDTVNYNMDFVEKSHADQIEYYTMWVHQIKTPISAMKLALQGMEVSQNKSVLEQELFKIEQYVEMALQYVKIKQLSTDLIIREYDLYQIVTMSVKKYASLFIYKKLSVDIKNFNFPVLTDSKWLSFVLEQILSNAIKYTYQGGIKIYQEGNSLIVEDSGIGIRPEDLERIFEKGYTGFNGRLDKMASGIGLYLAKKVADTLAVKIEIESKISSGTKAIFTFKEPDVDVYE
jgi:signal transduction histidine kinase